MHVFFFTIVPSFPLQNNMEQNITPKKTLESYNDVFSDIVTARLFNC